MLKLFTRRRPTSVDVDDPLAIRNLLDDPALQALVLDTGGTSDASVTATDLRRFRRRRADAIRARHLPRPRRLNRCL